MPLKTSCVYMTDCLDRVWENSISFKPVPPGCCTSYQLCFILGTGSHLKAAVECVGGGKEILRLYMKLRPSISMRVFWQRSSQEKKVSINKSMFQNKQVWPKTIYYVLISNNISTQRKGGKEEAYVYHTTIKPACTSCVNSQKYPLAQNSAREGLLDPGL